MIFARSVVALGLAAVALLSFHTGHSFATPGYPGGADPWAAAPGNGAPFNFDPQVTVKLCNDLPNSVPFSTMGIGGANGTCEVSPGENLAPGANPDITTTFNLAAGNYMPVSPYLINILPPAFTITGGQPPGTLMGGLASTTTLGLLGGACTTSTPPVNYILWNVALPNVPAHPWQSSNIAFPMAESVSDRFSHWKANQTGFGGSFATAADPGITTSGPPATATIADAGNAVFGGGNFPEYLLQLLDPAFVPGTPLSTYVNDTFTQPIAVYGGLTQVSGVWVPLMLVQMPAGGLSGFAPPNPFSGFPASLGQPNLAVLGDPLAGVAAPSPITSFCSPLTTETMLLGAPPAGPARITSPAAGTGRSGSHLFLTWVESSRDVDADGFQNNLDNCPLVANPTQATNPGSGSGIGAACDPAPGADQGLSCSPQHPGDADCDGFLNAADNCPFVSNPTQQESELTQAYSVAAPDAGPKTDHIGDPCDTGTVSAVIAGNAETITLSPTVANGHYNIRALVMPKCIGGTPDADGSGWCQGTTGIGRSYTFGSYQNLSVPVTTVTTGSGGTSSFSDFVKTWQGVDPARPCNHGASNGGITQSGAVGFWPPDFNNSGKTDLTDVVLLRPYFNSSLGPAWGPYPAAGYRQRFDLNADGNVSLTDVVLLRPLWVADSRTCTFVPQQ